RPEKLDERRSRTRTRAIRVRDEGIRLCAAELPRELAPQCVDGDAPALLVGTSGRDHLTNQHSRVGRRWSFDLGVGEHRLDPWKLVRWVSRREVVERDHRVRLAAPEVGLQLDNGVATLLAKAPHGVEQQLPQTIRQESAAEKLDRFAVLVSRLIAPDLMQV